jgi:2-methylcitrate dehydratase
MCFSLAEFHAQTAVEAAEIIFGQLKAKGKSAVDIAEVACRTNEACLRIIDKQFKSMDNFADRDHCIQYMCSVMLVFGRLQATDYEDGSDAATSPVVESLRKKMRCLEDSSFTADYHHPSRRFISNALSVRLNDGTLLDEVIVKAPLGHRSRRDEAKPQIFAKYARHIEPHFTKATSKRLFELAANSSELLSMSIDEYVDLYIVEQSPFL